MQHQVDNAEGNNVESRFLKYLCSCVKDDAFMVSGLAWSHAPLVNVH